MSGIAYVAADDLARFKINGTWVGRWGSVSNFSKAARANAKLKRFDITPFLKRGVNRLSVWAKNGPNRFGGCSPCTYAQNPAGVAFGFSIKTRGAAQWHVASARATFPGTNGLIAFTDVPDEFGPPFIEVVQPDGTYVTAIYSDDVAYSDPAWSPDGKMLALKVVLGFRVAPYIALARANGSHLHSVTGPRTRSPAWSPSGERIVYTQAQSSHSSNLFIKNLVTGEVTQLTHSPQGVANGYPDWSPDGTRVVFSRSVGNNTRLYTMTLSGRHLTRLTTDSLAPTYPSWSPDGTKVLFPGSDGDLHVLTMSTRHVETLVGPGYQGVWSPDGTSVAYVNHDLFVLPLGGSPIDIVSPDNDALFDPSWQSTASLGSSR